MTGSDFFLLLLCILIPVLALFAIVQKDLIRAVIAFAASSICLSALFYQLASPYSAVLELAVGAGLIAVLFLVALTLAGGKEEKVTP
jgi:uncharacterized MnhB-related membrane protein